MAKTLFAFDFDGTLINSSLRRFAAGLLKDRGCYDEKVFEETVVQGLSGKNWMAQILHVDRRLFGYLHSHGVQQSDFLRAASEVEWVDGMLDLVRTLGKEPSVDMIILSDNNSFWIDMVLAENQLESSFSGRFANKTVVLPDGQVQIDPYDVPSLNCPWSTASLCKGKALLDFAGQQQKPNDRAYASICYVGDGENDLCPGLCLTSADTLYVRTGYTLDKLITANSYQDKLKCQLTYWKSGDEILRNFYESKGVF